MAVRGITWHEGHVHTDDGRTRRACRDARHQAAGATEGFQLGYTAAAEEVLRLVEAQHDHAGNIAWAIQDWLRMVRLPS